MVPLRAVCHGVSNGGLHISELVRVRSAQNPDLRAVIPSQADQFHEASWLVGWSNEELGPERNG